MVSAKPYAPAVNPAPAPRRTTEGKKSTPWRRLPACWVSNPEERSLARHIGQQISQCFRFDGRKRTRLLCQSGFAQNADLIHANIRSLTGHGDSQPRSPCRPQHGGQGADEDGCHDGIQAIHAHNDAGPCFAGFAAFHRVQSRPIDIIAPHFPETGAAWVLAFLLGLAPGVVSYRICSKTIRHRLFPFRPILARRRHFPDGYLPG